MNTICSEKDKAAYRAAPRTETLEENIRTKWKWGGNGGSRESAGAKAVGGSNPNNEIPAKVWKRQ